MELQLRVGISGARFASLGTWILAFSVLSEKWRNAAVNVNYRALSKHKRPSLQFLDNQTPREQLSSEAWSTGLLSRFKGTHFEEHGMRLCSTLGSADRWAEAPRPGRTPVYLRAPCRTPKPNGISGAEPRRLPVPQERATLARGPQCGAAVLFGSCPAD